MDYPAQQYQNQQYQYQYQLEQQQGVLHDPSQVQAYDQSTTQAYYDYGYNSQQYQYYATHSYPPQHHDHASNHPPGVPIPTESTHLDCQQNTYYPVENPQDLVPRSDSGGLNPATLSQPAQLVWGMHAEQKALQPQIGQSSHVGGSRRGGRSFTGRGRGQTGYHGPRPDGSFRGRGRGHNGGRHFPPHGVATVPNSTFPPAEGAASLMLHSVSAPGHASVPAAPFRQPPRMAWCELCRVDCNTLEILEQHKNGKRHKKNLQMHEELQNLNKLITRQQNVQMPNSGIKPEVFQSENVVGVKENEIPQVDLRIQVVCDDNRNETEQQKDALVKSKASVADLVEESGKRSKDRFEAGGRSLNRKMRGGRRGKYVRTNDGSRRPAQPPKSKQAIPFVCELCNVKCESQVVYDSHLAGKKHLSKLKQFHGHQALYGEAGLQALYPPNLSAALPSFVPQIHHGVNDPQIVLAQLLTYVLAQAQMPGLTATTAAAAMPTPASGSHVETQYPNCPTQKSEAVSEAGTENDVMVEVGSQQQPITVELEALTTGIMDMKEENGAPACDVKNIILPRDNERNVSLPQDSSLMASLDPDTEGEQIVSVAASCNTVIMPECELASLNKGVKTGPCNKMEDSELRGEDPNEI